MKLYVFSSRGVRSTFIFQCNVIHTDTFANRVLKLAKYFSTERLAFLCLYFRPHARLLSAFLHGEERLPLKGIL
jgi:hypothetical protein